MEYSRTGRELLARLRELRESLGRAGSRRRFSQESLAETIAALREVLEVLELERSVIQDEIAYVKLELGRLEALSSSDH